MSCKCWICSKSGHPSFEYVLEKFGLLQHDESLTMSGPLSLAERNDAKDKVKQRSAASLVVVISIGGLIAGLLTAALDYPLSRLRLPGHGLFVLGLLGAPFGVALVISLAVGGLLRGLAVFWKTLPIIVLSSSAYLVSYWAAVGVELASGKRQLMDQYPSYSPLSMFTGGFLGGFLLFYGVLLLFHPRQICVSVMFRIILSSVLTGVLGIVGWNLGERHSLFVVWQTGTAFLLGLILRSLPSRSITRSTLKGRVKTGHMGWPGT